MNKIWAKQLVLGVKVWSDVPASRRAAVKGLLQGMIENGDITEEQYNSIVGNTENA